MSISLNALGPRMTMDGPNTVESPVKKQYVPATLPTTTPAPATVRKLDLESVNAEIERVQAELSSRLGTKVQFNVNQELGKVIVKVVDPSTDKVIREIPSEDVQALQIKMKHISALLVDEVI
ncbi:MAG: flagellar protein FlaG [Spirochaetaceae bacterium]|nr:flagellar protein FlaG [Spirochaetaceae bacterium]MBO7419756.1 flagellar protein FlaG [Spirochaetaceae bacterium]MBP5794200.1 flagellar protein FlaG [Spirochaetaceae bacterium]